MTNRLEKFGIQPGHDVQHQQMADYGELKQSGYFDRATTALGRLAPAVFEDVVPNLDEVPGRWNPGGFIVFPLGMHNDLGSLRLHVWPKGMSRESENGPNIHNHAWLLASQVLTGMYKDTLYDVQPSLDDEQPPEGEEPLRLYRRSRDEIGRDVLVTDGKPMIAVPVEERRVPAGGTHTIDRDVYHLTTIPDDELAATLVFDSPAFAPSTEVLIRGRERVIEARRPAIDLAALALAQEQLQQITF